MHIFRMLLYIRTRILHYYCILQQNILQVFNLYFLIPTYLEGRFSPIYLVVLSRILSSRLYMGDLWPCFQGPPLSKLGFRGGVRIYNPPLTKLSIILF